MPAPPHNTNAAKNGISLKIRIRVPSPDHAELITTRLTPEKRGHILWQAAQKIMDTEATPPLTASAVPRS